MQLIIRILSITHRDPIPLLYPFQLLHLSNLPIPLLQKLVTWLLQQSNLLEAHRRLEAPPWSNLNPWPWLNSKLQVTVGEVTRLEQSSCERRTDQRLLLAKVRRTTHILGSGTWKPDLTKAVCQSTRTVSLNSASAISSPSTSATFSNNPSIKGCLALISKVYYFDYQFWSKAHREWEKQSKATGKRKRLTRFWVFIKLVIKLSLEPEFCDAINLSIFPVQAYESETMRHGEVVSRVDITTVVTVS